MIAGLTVPIAIGTVFEKNSVSMGRWVKSFEGVEPYRPGQRASEVRRELGLKRLTKLSSNECPLPPFETARAAMAQGIKGLNRYPDGACHLLKSRLVGHLGVAYERLTVGNGSNELIRLLAQVVLDEGDEVVMARPSFVVYPLVTKVTGATAVEVPLKDLRHDLPAMAAAVTDKTKLIFVCNPNNPTGTVVGADEARAFMESVPERVLVCFDEAYHEYVVDPAYASAVKMLDRFENIVVLRTFSKIYGLAGARIGYGAAPVEAVEAIDKVREPFNVNMLGQIGAYWSLADREEIIRRRRLNEEQKRAVHQALAELGLKYAPSRANFVYFDPGVSAAEVFEKLKRSGVIVRAFGDGNYLRVTLGVPKETARLIEALRAVLKP